MIAGGRRYWPMVRMSQPTAARSRKTSRSSWVLRRGRPSRRISLLLRGLGSWSSGSIQGSARSARRSGLRDKARHGFGVVVEHFGLRVTTVRMASRLPWKSGMRTSTRQPGLAANFVDDHGEDARAAQEIVVAVDAGDHCMERPNGRLPPQSARLVKIDGSGRPLGRADRQRRVQRLPSIMKVAVLWCQHSRCWALGAFADRVQASERARRLREW